MMSDKEYEVMDELYFVQTFEELQDTLHMQEEELKDILWGLIEKQWVRCDTSVNLNAIAVEKTDFYHNFKKYHYLATKAGLLAHNSK